MPSTPKNILLSNSLKETEKIARQLARSVAAKRGERASVIALSGNLGTGKTSFTKAFLRSLGVKETVSSPTFVLSREYVLSSGKHKKAYHIDIYRLTEKEARVLELKKIFKEKNAIVLIEWAEKIKKLIPKRAIWIYFRHGRTKEHRLINIHPGPY